MKSFNIYMTGVGGQGIGLLSQAVLRSIDHAGLDAVAVDTHGLAQRGGVVVSQVRCGKGVHSPLIMAHQADLVLGLEIHEAARALGWAMKQNGTLVFLNVSWQPLPVRLGQVPEVSGDAILEECKRLGVTGLQVDTGSLKDARMQNMALLGSVCNRGLLPGVKQEHFKAALEDLLTGRMLNDNLALFETYA